MASAGHARASAGHAWVASAGHARASAGHARGTLHQPTMNRHEDYNMHHGCMTFMTSSSQKSKHCDTKFLRYFLVHMRHDQTNDLVLVSKRIVYRNK